MNTTVSFGVAWSALTVRLFILGSVFASFSSAGLSSVKAMKLSKENELKLSKIDKLKYRVYPKRRSEESAVIEWGHSAIISALDAVVAEFGPQTSRGALFEVETAPVLADPIDGHTGLGEGAKEKKVLNNAEDIVGNMVVMTNAAGMSGVQMATLAKNSGAVALMVVNTLESENPDYIYSLQCESDEECEYAEDHIDIPVVMVSLTSGNVLTTANSEEVEVDEDEDEDEYEDEQQQQLGLPERVRLYAGGDRPFFEDVSNDKPVVYLIHNLLTEEECDALISAAMHKVELVNDEDSNLLEGMGAKDPGDPGVPKNVQRTYLWKGMLKSFEAKAIDERIEQVTGFPQDHLSDFQVNKYEDGSSHGPWYDSIPSTSQSQMASIHIFLTDTAGHSGGELVFPLGKKPIKVVPKKGMAVVYHNTDEQGNLDLSTIHAELELQAGASAEGRAKWTAKKWIYTMPPSQAQRIVLPLLAAPFGGKAPYFVKSLHNSLVDKYGPDDGSMYFDQIALVVPILVLFGVASLIGMVAKIKQSSDRSSTSEKPMKDKAKGLSSKNSKRKKKGD